jgi:hypothetical protein
VSAKGKASAHEEDADLRQERQQFVRTFLADGVELSERHALDATAVDLQLSQLRDENTKLRAQLASSDAIRDLLTTIDGLKQERTVLLQRSGEFSVQQQRQWDIERELNDLASLYVASFQLSSTLSLGRVIKHMCELLEQLVGAHSFVLYVLTEDARRAIPVGALGKLPTPLASIELSAGTTLADVCESGIPRVLEPEDPRGPGEPLVVLPMMFASKVVALIVVHELLPHKRVWAKVDRELFKLLAVQGATALIAANLYAKESDPRAALQDILVSLETERHKQLVAADPDAGGDP